MTYKKNRFSKIQTNLDDIETFKFLFEEGVCAETIYQQSHYQHLKFKNLQVIKRLICGVYEYYLIVHGVEVYCEDLYGLYYAISSYTE